MSFSSFSFKNKIGLVSLAILASQLVCPWVEAMEPEDTPPQNNNRKRKIAEESDVSVKIENNNAEDEISIKIENNNLNMGEGFFTKDEEITSKRAKTTVSPNNLQIQGNNNFQNMWSPWTSLAQHQMIQNHYPNYIPVHPNYIPAQTYNYIPAMTRMAPIQPQPPILQNTFIGNPFQIFNHVPVHNPDRNKVLDKSQLKVISTFLLCIQHLNNSIFTNIPKDVTDYIIQYYINLSPRIAITQLKPFSGTNDTQLLKMIDASPIIKNLDLSRTIQILGQTQGKVTAAGLLAAVKKCSRLNSLSLPSGMNITGEELKKVIQECPHLTSLTLPSCCPQQTKGKKIPGEELLAALKSCVKLTSLNLISWKHLTGEQVQNLVGFFPNLTSLVLESCTKIKGTEVVPIVKKCPKLDSLSLEDLEISVKQLLALGDERPNMTFLRLPSRQKNARSEKDLMAIFDKFSNLSFLDLRQWKDITGAKFLNLVKKHSNLTSFELPHSGWKLDADQFLSVVKSCPNLNTLDLGWLEDRTTIAQFQDISAAYSKLLNLRLHREFFPHHFEPQLVFTVMQGHPELTSVELGHSADYDPNYHQFVLEIAKMCPNLATLRLLKPKEETIAQLTKKYPRLIIKRNY